jgi:hypothetical protein
VLWPCLTDVVREADRCRGWVALVPGIAARVRYFWSSVPENAKSGDSWTVGAKPIAKIQTASEGGAPLRASASVFTAISAKIQAQTVHSRKRRMRALPAFAADIAIEYVGRRSPPCPPPTLLTANRQPPSGGFFGRTGRLRNDSGSARPKANGGPGFPGDVTTTRVIPGDRFAGRAIGCERFYRSSTDKNTIAELKTVLCCFSFAVPELTRNTNIKLNPRVSLQIRIGPALCCSDEKQFSKAAEQITVERGRD